MIFRPLGIYRNFRIKGTYAKVLAFLRHFFFNVRLVPIGDIRSDTFTLFCHSPARYFNCFHTM